MDIKSGKKVYSVEFYGLNGVECSENLVSDCTYNEEKEVYELNEGVTIEDIINYLKEEVDKSENEEYYVEVYINDELMERHYGDGENFIFSEDEKDIIKDEIDLKILLDEVKNMSFEEGKAYIKENYTNYNIIHNEDKDYNILDIDFYFDTIENDDDFLSFTSKVKLNDEIYDLKSGYWNIHGETA